MPEVIGYGTQRSTKLEQTVQAFRDQLVQAQKEKTTGQITALVDLGEGGINSSKIGVVKNVLTK